MEQCFNSINIFNRNSKRLSKTSVKDVALEVLKNGMTYSKSHFDIRITDESIEFFNDLDDNILNTFTIDMLRTALEVFGQQSESNFHEGITTYLKLKVGIFVNNVFQISKKYIDGNYQLIEECSHDEHGKLISDKYGITNGWKVVFYNDGNILFEHFKNILIEILHSFYVTPSFTKKVYLNGEKFNFEEMPSISNYERMYSSGNIYYKIEDTSLLHAPITHMWTVDKHMTIFHALKTDRRMFITGNIVFTDIRQFANENRVELAANVQKELDDLIEGIFAKHIKRANEMKLIEEADNYIEEMATSIAFHLKGNKQKIIEKIAIGKDNKEKLERIIRFCKKTNSLFDYFEIDKKIYHINLIDTHESTMNNVSFSDYCRKCDIDFRTLEDFKNAKIGPIVTDGDVDGIMLLQDFTSETIVANEDDITLMELINEELNGTIVLNTCKYLQALIYSDLLKDYNTVDFSSDKELVRWNNISELENFNVIDESKEQLFDDTTKAQQPVGSAASQVMAGNLNNVSLGDIKNLINAMANAIGNIKSAPIRTNINGKTKNGNIVTVDDIIPVVFYDKQELEYHKNNNFDTIRRYKYVYLTWKFIVTAIAKHAHITQPIYPILSVEKTKNIAANSNGIISLNIHNVLKTNSRLNSIALIEDAAHEISHLFYSNHGKKLYQKMESILRDIKMPIKIGDKLVDIYAEAFEILFHDKNPISLEGINKDKLQYFRRWLLKHEADLQEAVKNEDDELIKSITKKINNIRIKIQEL